ncbi:MAG: hypothetical protein GY906_10315 [bacterium]|nr:hypothetical protein [bacterium]
MTYDPDDQTWDTLEVERWIDNTEPLYNASKTCLTAADYQAGFEDLLNSLVDMDEVNWDYIAQEGQVKNEHRS